MNLPQNIVSKITALGAGLDLKKIGLHKQKSKIKKTRIYHVPNQYASNKQQLLYELLTNIDLPKFVFSRRGASYVDNARYHIGSHYLVNVDIKNFYPSINYKRIGHIFSELRIKISAIEPLTYLTTCDKYLPLGFVTSPFLSNLVLLKVDNDLFKLSRNNKVKYSRYVDDVSFSSNHEIDEKFIQGATRVLKSMGFSLNDSKTRIYGPSDKKIVHGLVLEDHTITISQEYLNLVKVHIEELQNRKKNKVNFTESKSRVDGELSFIKYIDMKKYNDLVTSYSLE